MARFCCCVLRQDSGSDAGRGSFSILSSRVQQLVRQTTAFEGNSSSDGWAVWSLAVTWVAVTSCSPCPELGHRVNGF